MKTTFTSAIAYLLAAGAIQAETVVVNEKISITGDSGSYTLKVDAQHNKLGSIQTTGADIVLDNQNGGTGQTLKLQEASSMTGGSLTLYFSAAQAAANASPSYIWGSTSSTETAFSGATLKLDNVKVTLHQTEGEDFTGLDLGPSYQRYGVTLYTISNTYGSSWTSSSELTVDSPLLEKYFTDYHFASDYYYTIDPVYPVRPIYPIYPDYTGTYGEDDLPAGTVVSPDYWDAIIIRPYPVRGNIKVVANRELDYFGKHLGSRTPNGAKGMEIVGLVSGLYAPQLAGNRDTMPDFAMVMDSLDVCISTKNTRFADRLTAAVAGASTTILSAAALGDVERQLRSIRNRTSSLYYDGSTGSRPLRNIWFNAEGDYRKLDASGTDAGYSLCSSGATFGLDYNVGRSLILGASSTVMSGNLKADGPEARATGDMDSTYLNLYARYDRKTWTHTLLMTVGRADLSLDRTVATGLGSYTTRGRTNSRSFGLLYEVADNIPLGPDGEACVQPLFNVSYRHVSVDGYTETGSDAALHVDKSSMNAVTFGVGARLQTPVGRSFLNRKARLEVRGLLKMDTRDRAASTTITLPELLDWEEDVWAMRGAKASAAGIELGAGLYVPVGPKGGTLFLDASFETRHNAPEANVSAGYRLSF